MPKKQITSSKIRQPTGHFSHATMIETRGRLVFISGMTSRRADGTIAGVGDIEVQTRQVCENVKAAVEEAGGTMDDICRVEVYVRNMEHFDLIHKVRRDYFRAPAPASTMVEVTKMTSPDYLIEMNAIAVIGE
jgi:2-iminobutanoate/2-iminopropanoate deaminase